MIEVAGLSKIYKSGLVRKKEFYAVSNVSFSIKRGETLGLIGESGSGKSTLGQCLIRLSEPSEGKIIFDGIDITSLGKSELKKMRPRMQIIFQDPDSSLNPRMRLQDSILEPYRIHDIKDTKEYEKLYKLIESVGLSEEHMMRFPHQLSGGQKQRAVLARALSMDPDFLVADEPTASLDVSVQAQILVLLQKIKQKFRLTMLFISHDFNIIRHMCDSVVVMYKGHAVESGTVKSVFEKPLHPYTRALLKAGNESEKPSYHKEMNEISINVSSDRKIKQNIEMKYGKDTNLTSRCPFFNECNKFGETCISKMPSFQEQDRGHFVLCHGHDEM